MKAWILLLIGSSVLFGCTPKTSQKSVDATAKTESPVDDRLSAGVPSTEEEPASSEPSAETRTSSPATGVDPSDPASPVIEISFDEIQLPIQTDMVFRPFMLTERVQELDGKRVRIHGYMLPDTKTKGITQFVMLKNLECKFGPGGQADHLINVLMNEGVTARFREDPISVEGVLKINPFTGPDGNTWSIYDLACDRVERYRPRR